MFGGLKFDEPLPTVVRDPVHLLLVCREVVLLRQFAAAVDLIQGGLIAPPYLVLPTVAPKRLGVFKLFPGTGHKRPDVGSTRLQLQAPDPVISVDWKFLVLQPLDDRFNLIDCLAGIVVNP